MSRKRNLTNVVWLAFGIFQFLDVPAIAFWFIFLGVQSYRHGTRLVIDAVSRFDPSKSSAMPPMFN